LGCPIHKPPFLKGKKTGALWIHPSAFLLAIVLFYVPSRQYTIKSCDES
jgi:hypothetical protein